MQLEGRPPKMGPAYLAYLEQVAERDVEVVRQKDAEYGGSWLRRGGVGVFMMLARKWDRIEQQVQQPMLRVNEGPTVSAYDIIARAQHDPRAEGLRDDVADLRRYLLLLEAHLEAEEDRAAQNLIKG